MNPIRSLLAVLGGFVIFQMLAQLLEVTLVAFVSGGPPADEAAFLAIRNRPGILAARVGCSAVAGVLAGYIAARIAAGSELRHAAGAAMLVSISLLMEFTTDFAPPLWARAAILAVAGPMMLAGAWVRASAAAAAPPAETRRDGGTG